MNITSVKTASNGVFQGDDPLRFAFPLLIVQTTLILLITRLLAFLFKPLRQPKVVAEIVGGVLLGPSALGRNKTYMQTVFPEWSTPVLESVASIGLLFFLFMVGLELDLTTIRRSGSKALSIAAAGITIPFICGLGVAFIFRKSIDGVDKVGFFQFILFMGVALSITAFPVLARILAELKLLTTRVGETAMAAAAFNDVMAWIFLALAVAIAGSGPSEGIVAGNNYDHKKSPLVSLWVLLCGVGFVLFMAGVVRPIMHWLVVVVVHSRPSYSASDNVLDEVYIALTLTGVLVSGFVTDLIGIHSIFGAFVFGLVIPKGENLKQLGSSSSSSSDFASRLLHRIEDFVAGLLLPLYFASSGLKTNVATIRGVEAWALLVLVIFAASAGKIAGSFVAAVACGVSATESLVLGVLMNTKGLVELIVLNIGREKKVLNDQMFAILVLMALFTTFITTPAVMAVYKFTTPRPSNYSGRPPAAHRHQHRRKLQYFTTTSTSTTISSSKSTSLIRVLACVHGPGNVPATMTLVDSICHTCNNSNKLYAMHLVQLTDRSSSIVMVQRLRRNGLPFINRSTRSTKLEAEVVHDPVAIAFQAYGQLGRVKVRHVPAISPLHTIHEDVCHVAEEKQVTLIVLPFHKRWRRIRKNKNDDDDNDNDGSSSSSRSTVVENVGHAWRLVNQKVLKHAQCSVALLVDRASGFGGTNDDEEHSREQTVCVLFFGGPDDREALELGERMADHAAVKLTVMRFVELVDSTTTTTSQTALSTFRLMPTLDKSADNSYSFSVDALMNPEEDKALDEVALTKFTISTRISSSKLTTMHDDDLKEEKATTTTYMERPVLVSNIIEQVLAIGRSGEFDLIVVGKGRFPSPMVATLADLHAEHPELGPIGDILSSSTNGVLSSVLVVQQHHLPHVDELPACKLVQPEHNPV